MGVISSGWPDTCVNIMYTVGLQDGLLVVA